MKLLDIGEVCERSGFRPSALRRYEDVRLILSFSRKGLRRQFAPEIIMQLALISMGKSAGFSLDEISRMLGHDGQPNSPRATLHQKADELDRQIVELTALS